MNDQMKSTNQIIKFENGKKTLIYKKLTKKGIRYYYRSDFRFIPISELTINKLICNQ